MTQNVKGDGVTNDIDDVRSIFKEAMAGIATPVSVVTTMTDDKPVGTTVSAFASLSMDPPMVLVSLDRASETLAQIRRSMTFGLNILGAHQTSIALRFATKGGTDKFIETPWELAQGLPRIPDSPGWIACRVSALVPGGDHVIALGEVVAGAVGDHRPLVYHSRAFGTHGPYEPSN